jgi:hypothetical protein
MKKPRSDSKLLNLPEATQLAIYELLRSGVGYTKAKLIIQKDHGIQTSEAALSGFWDWWSRQEAENRMLKAVSAATDITETAAEHLPLINQATMAALQQAAFETVLAGGDDRRVKDFMTIVLKARALDQADQTLALRVREFEQKIAAVEQTLKAAKKDGGLDPETIAKIEQQLGLL